MVLSNWSWPHLPCRRYSRVYPVRCELCYHQLDYPFGFSIVGLIVWTGFHVGQWYTKTSLSGMGISYWKHSHSTDESYDLVCTLWWLIGWLTERKETTNLLSTLSLHPSLPPSPFSLPPPRDIVHCMCVLPGLSLFMPQSQYGIHLLKCWQIVLYMKALCK